MQGLYVYFLLLFLLDVGSLDDGSCLKEVIKVQHQCMGDNFFSSLLVMGGVGLAVHYEQLTKKLDGVPLIMAFGLPISGKSTAVEVAMALVGQFDKIGGEI